MVFLNKKQVEDIDDLVENIIVEYNFNAPSDLVADLANRIGIRIEVAEFKDDDVAGLLYYGSKEDKDDSPAIFIKSSDDSKKRNFTIAHEIGHFFLHKANEGKFKVDRYEFKNDVESLEETQANYFAAALLVPKDKLKEIVFKARVPEWDLINLSSNYFNVSRSAIKNRLKWISF